MNTDKKSSATTFRATPNAHTQTVGQNYKDRQIWQKNHSPSLNQTPLNNDQSKNKEIDNDSKFVANAEYKKDRGTSPAQTCRTFFNKFEQGFIPKRSAEKEETKQRVVEKPSDDTILNFLDKVINHFTPPKVKQQVA